MRNITRTTLAVAALAVAVSTSACTTQGVERPANDVALPPAAVSAPPAPYATPSPSASVEDQLVAFGDEWDYEDGITVTVAVVGPSVAGEYAAGADVPGGEMILFDVTVTNNSKAIFDPTTATSTVNYGTTTAHRVFDYSNGIISTFEGKILPGASLTERQAYAIPTSVPNDVLFSVAPSYSHDDALFYGTLNDGAAS